MAAIQGQTCVACGAAATLACPACGDEFYCSEKHVKSPYLSEKHDVVCAWNVRQAQRASRPQPQSADAPPVVRQDSPLLALGDGVLFRLCGFLRADDLVRLGQVCRALRSVCRDARAWGGVVFSASSSSYSWPNEGPRLFPYGVLKIAPALHTMNVSYQWPAVNLLRYTNKVKVFELDYEDASGEMVEDWDKERLFHTIRHYSQSLEVVKLACLHEMDVLRLIDRMPHVRELYIGSHLVKVYPGCTKVVKSLSLGHTVGGEVVADFIRANCNTLESFTVSEYKLNRNRWAHCGDKSPLWKELKKCHGLVKMSVMPPLSMINSFPHLRKFSMKDFGDEKHAKIKRAFTSSPVIRNLTSLNLQMGYHGHRGLLKVVGTSCVALRQLAILFRSSGRMDFVTVHVDVPRDLHLILAGLANLEKLTLSVARVPSTVLDGIAQGALPTLTHLKLNSCGVTSKGREALARLRERRGALQLDAKVSKARTQHDACWDWLPQRCNEAMCRARSECADDDPVSEPDGGDSDGGSSSGFPEMDSTHFDDFACMDSDSG